MPQRPVFEAFAIGLAARIRKKQQAWLKSTARRLFPLGATVRPVRPDRSQGSKARTFTITPVKGRRLSTGASWEIARTLSAQPGVRYAEPLFRSAGLEPDPKHRDDLLAPHERTRGGAAGIKSSGEDKPLPCAATDVTWSLEQIRAPEAWALAPTNGGAQFGEGIVVGHPDTGYRKHDEIWDPDAAKRRVLPSEGYDFEDDDADPTDPMDGSNPGHGTATASVIMSARASAGETTVVGSAPQAQLVPIRVSGSVIHFSFKNVTEAIYHAVDRCRAHVISMSLGGPFHSKALEEAVDHAISQGVIVLAAAGNVWPWVVYPARLDQVIAVAACNCRQGTWKKSASGPAVDLAAPGESVWRARSEKKAGTVTYSIAPGSGTSYAVATTAGACATWLAFHGRARLLAKYGPARLPGVFRTLLTGSACVKPAGWDTKNFGAGILDLELLLQAPLPAGAAVVKAKMFPQRVRRESAADRIAAYFPELTKSQVRAALARSFAGPAGVKAALAESLGPELAFHVATNASVRGRIHAQALRPSIAAAGKRGSALAPAKRDASPTLRRALGL